MQTRLHSAKFTEGFWQYLLRISKDVLTYRHALRNIVNNNVQQRYRRSFLGILWSFLNPLLNLAVMSAVFSLLFNQDPLQFSIYQLSGLVTWSFMSSAILSGTQALIGAEGFLKKLYVPKVMFPLILVCTEIVNFCFGLFGYYSIGLILGLHLSLTHFFLLPAVLIMSVFVLGLVLIFSTITVFFRDIAHILQVVIQGVMWCTPIFYKMDFIPEHSRAWFKFNPFFHFVQLVRALIYENRLPATQEWVIPIVMAMTTLMIGLVVLKRAERIIVYRL
jgi:ABC-2 type transport system permease protein/lipopolysaccharide transport system permease protein